jgi:endonuclease/exonuclease/phosphatase (EEP) superfamily protein YafD
VHCYQSVGSGGGDNHSFGIILGMCSLVSLNTRGVPLFGSRLAHRYAAIGSALEAGDAEVVCFQEVLTWWHLKLLTRRMRSFRHVSLRPSAPGPAGGLVTFSRLPAAGTSYRGFGIPPKAPGITRATRLRAGLKGALVTRLTRPARLTVINTHPTANWDGDWSAANRFYPLHRAQLDVLARVVRTTDAPLVVCGDFNVDRDSPVFAGFVASTGLADAFAGNCPPTFRAEYLPPNAKPHCIDFILTGDGVQAEDATIVFADKEPLPGEPGYVSDHLGLRVTLSSGHV